MIKRVKSNAFLILAIALTVVFSMFLASAQNLVAPASSATISGSSVLLNATNASLPQMVNCSFYAGSPSTANTTWTLLGVGTNSSANAGNINISFNSNVLEDSNDYSFMANCTNSSGTISATPTNTGITVDNTVPDAPTLTSPATATNIVTATTQTFTCGVSNQKTTRCSFLIGRNSAYSASSADSSSTAMSYSASTCTITKTFSTISDNGEWYWTCSASDGTNSTSASTNNVVHVQIPGNSGNLAVSQQNGNNAAGSQPLSIGVNTSSGNVTWGIIAGIIIVVFILYLVFKDKR